MPRHSEKDDYLEAGKPVHRLSYCAFLDVLGLSERIRASYKNKAADKLLQEFHAIFKRRISRLKSDVDESLLYFKSFSDNVLLAHPRFSEDMESEFGFILWSISEYQFEMALQGFFIRGGLSVGPLFVDDNSVYGEALINAYHLESKVAVSPIVVLCDNTMKLVDKHIGYYHGDVAPQVSHVLVNADGRYFITTSPNVSSKPMKERRSIKIPSNNTKIKSNMRLPNMPDNQRSSPNSHGLRHTTTTFVTPYRRIRDTRTN